MAGVEDARVLSGDRAVSANGAGGDGHAEIIHTVDLTKVYPGADFAAERIAAAASELLDLVVDAWNASATTGVGYPATPVSEIEAGRADAWQLLYGDD